MGWLGNLVCSGAIIILVLAIGITPFVVVFEYYYQRRYNPGTTRKYPVAAVVVIVIGFVCVGSYIALGILYPLLSK